MTDQSLLGSSLFEKDVTRALSRRGKAMLEAADLAAQVPKLEPLEAYFLVKEIGITDAMPILKLATAEQLQAFIDLDCWSEDRPDPVELDAWLSSFAGEGLEALASAFLSLDAEIQVLHLAASMQIYEAGNPDIIPEQRDDVPRMVTTDTFYVLDAVDADTRELHPFTLVEALYATAHEEAFRLLTAARWEVTSTLEEMALNFRNGRLEDMGFPPRAEALGIFAPPQLSAPVAVMTPPPVTLPAVYAQPLTEGALLTRALHAVQNPALATRLTSDLVYLINAAILAYGGSPRDVIHVSEIAARVRDTASLGLEILLEREAGIAAGAVDQAVAEATSLLERRNLRDLFRVGHQEAVTLQKEARALASDPVVSQWLNTLSTEKDDYGQDRLDRELLHALVEPRPLYGGFEPLRPERRKAFGTRAEIHQAETRLDAMAKRIL